LQDQITEPCLRFDELPDDGAEHREHEADIQARKYEGQCLRQLNVAEDLPTARRQRSEQIDLGFAVRCAVRRSC
jgi:hypothetical protein